MHDLFCQSHADQVWPRLVWHSRTQNQNLQCWGNGRERQGSDSDCGCLPASTHWLLADAFLGTGYIKLASATPTHQRSGRQSHVDQVWPRLVRHRQPQNRNLRYRGTRSGEMRLSLTLIVWLPVSLTWLLADAILGYSTFTAIQVRDDRHAAGLMLFHQPEVKHSRLGIEAISLRRPAASRSSSPGWALSGLP
jgi:hypothetical protein